MTQPVAVGAIHPIVVSYYTDFNSSSTRPELPILVAGYVPRQIKNISSFASARSTC
jgi:hypothetical protein